LVWMWMCYVHFSVYSEGHNTRGLSGTRPVVTVIKIMNYCHFLSIWSFFRHLVCMIG
jgi:hypothetical protein